MPTFRELLQEAVERYGSQSAAADAIGMDRTRFGRVLLSLQRFEDAVQGQSVTMTLGELGAPPSFEVVNCLRLARALGRSPSEVLQAAGKSEEADLIEQMYGSAHNLVLTDEEHALIHGLRPAPIDPGAARKLTLKEDADRLQGLMLSMVSRLSDRITELRRAVDEIEVKEEEALRRAETERQERRSKDRWARVLAIRDDAIRDETSDGLRKLERDELLAWVEVQEVEGDGSAGQFVLAKRRWERFDALIEDHIAAAVQRWQDKLQQRQIELENQLRQELERIQLLISSRQAETAEIHTSLLTTTRRLEELRQLRHYTAARLKDAQERELKNDARLLGLSLANLDDEIHALEALVREGREQVTYTESEMRVLMARQMHATVRRQLDEAERRGWNRQAETLRNKLRDLEAEIAVAAANQAKTRKRA